MAMRGAGLPGPRGKRWRWPLLAAGVDTQFVQDNQAFNAKKGHGPRPAFSERLRNAQGKLVQVLKGAIFDVAVDVRPGSATYGRWVGATLTAETGEQLWVPRGFAHGYMTIADDTELFYKVDGDYAPTLEGGLIWNDPDIGKTNGRSTWSLLLLRGRQGAAAAEGHAGIGVLTG